MKSHPAAARPLVLILSVFASALVGPLSVSALTVHPRVSEAVPMVTTNRVVLTQVKRTISIPKQGVFVSNEFEGARLNDFQATGRGTFTATIAPENHPINDSGWYAFKIWSTSNQTVRVKLDYQSGKHRYQPQISHDGEHWQKLSATEVATSRGENSATLTLTVGPQPLFVCGQELFTSKDFKRWMDQLGQHPFVRSRELGKSTQGRPIYEMEISEAGPGARLVLVLSRQHPPEVTGTFALRAFIETICADTQVARDFRKQFKVVVVPEANPDGVDGGNWRHNAHGVDLNRDWGQFNQVETRLLRDEFLRLQKEFPGKLAFGLDFHSTFHDVFYPSQKTPKPMSGEAVENDGAQIDDFVWKWLNQIQKRVPEYEVNIEASRRNSTKTPTRTSTSTSWMRHVLGIPAVTYEAGDQTDRKLIHKVAEQGATAMMELLLAE